MKKKTGKLIAPIIIAALLILYYIGAAVLMTRIPDIPGAVKALMIAVPLLLAGVVIFVLAERVQEVRSGEEDDLDKY